MGSLKNLFSSLCSQYASTVLGSSLSWFLLAAASASSCRSNQHESPITHHTKENLSHLLQVVHYRYTCIFSRAVFRKWQNCSFGNPGRSPAFVPISLYDFPKYLGPPKCSPALATQLSKVYNTRIKSTSSLWLGSGQGNNFYNECNLHLF